MRGPWFTPDLTWPVLGVPPGQPCVPSGECRWKCAHQCFKQGPSGGRVYTQVGAWRQGSESPREARGACAQRLGSSLQLVRDAGGPGWPRSPGWPPPPRKCHSLPTLGPTRLSQKVLGKSQSARVRVLGLLWQMTTSRQLNTAEVHSLMAWRPDPQAESPKQVWAGLCSIWRLRGTFLLPVAPGLPWLVASWLVCGPIVTWLLPECLCPLSSS